MTAATEELVILDMAQTAHALEELTNAVRALVNDQRKPLAMLRLAAGSTIFAPYQLRVTTIILTATAAAVITLHKGSETWDFPFAGADTKILPIPMIIGAGLDLSITASAGTGAAWLVGTSEPDRPSGFAASAHAETEHF